MGPTGGRHTGRVSGKRIDDKKSNEKLQVENEFFRNGTFRFCRRQRSKGVHNGGESTGFKSHENF